MSYYLSIELTDLVARKVRWREKANSKEPPPVEWLGTAQSATDPPGGYVVMVNDTGEVERSLPLWGPEGILVDQGCLLVACPWDIKVISLDLSQMHRVLSGPWCNYLHSLRRSHRGLLVAATGIDAIVEISREGELLWAWWATEQGFRTDFLGGERRLDKEMDHRGLKYDTKTHTTHVNSAVELPDGSLLATLSHQGYLVRIDRKTGRHSTLLEDLGRPHCVRVFDERHITVVDTRAGEALLVRLDRHYARARVAGKIQTETTYLHDAHFDGKTWLLVDGLHSRVFHADADGRMIRVDNFDADWGLYEAIPSTH
ncbi:MAG: hypothetical protein KC418_19685 [Anaerolineales bacterium]|nr:hypothetical protein [Anaerolineales bacterium]